MIIWGGYGDDDGVLLACLMIAFAPCGMLIVNADLSCGSIGARRDTTRAP